MTCCATQMAMNQCVVVYHQSICKYPLQECKHSCRERILWSCVQINPYCRPKSLKRQRLRKRSFLCNQSLDPSHHGSGTVLEAAPQHLTMCLVPCENLGTEQPWMRTCGKHARKLPWRAACTILSPMDTSRRQSQGQAEHIKNTLT